MNTITKAVNEGLKLASEKRNEFIRDNGENAYCGFAWVSVKVERTNSVEAKELLSLGFTTNYKPKSLIYWGAGSYRR